MIATRVSAMALAAALGVAAASASAQTPPPQRQPGSMGYPTWAPGSQLRGGEREAAHLKALHDALNIRPDQEEAFQAFTASMKSAEQGPPPDGTRPDRQQLAAMTTPERLDAMSRMMDERMQRMRERFQRHAAAVKTLYAALSPDQRRTMDALPGLMGHGMGMGRGMDKDRGPMGRPGMGADHPPGEGR